MTTSWTSTSFSSLPNQAQTDENKNSANLPDDILTPNAGYFAINDAGVYALEDPTKYINSFNPDSSARNLYVGNNADLYSCAECDFFNLGQFEEIQPEFERYNVNFKVNYDVTDDLNVYFDANTSTAKAKALANQRFLF
ncbi:hypothetical protein ACOBV8_20025 (plasmid) [Pseudoalteromonas espejiana]